MSIEHELETMVTRKMAASLFVWDTPLKAEINITPLRAIENMLIIKKRFKM